MEFRTYKVEFETFVEGFPEKFQFDYPKKLKLLKGNALFCLRE